VLKLDGNKIVVSTKTLDATLIDGAIVSLTDKAGFKYIETSENDAQVINLVYRNNQTVPIRNTRKGKIYSYQISDTCVEIRYDAWDGNAVITVSEDIATGDLCIEPEATSARHGVLAARYYIDGITEGSRIVAPFNQGVNMELDDPLLKEQRRTWPHNWEAGFLIFQNDNKGFWVRCEDDKYHAKSVVTGTCKSGKGVALDAETWGPVEYSLSAGGIIWKINVYKGDYHVPAEQYRLWLWKAYNLEAEESRRKEWQSEVKMGVSWCPTDIKLIDELAKKVDPKSVLLHLPNWRVNKYDTCYPDFTPSENFKTFINRARELGYHCMPHANSVDMDPSMPEYHYLQDFKYRSVDGGYLLGWGWEDGHALGVPTSNVALQESRDKLVMVKIHPGLAIWRSMLAQNIKSALDQLNNVTDAVFIDVTLCSYNLENALIDNTTSTEGMKRLIAHIEDINGGIAVGGEGLNEITMQNQSFAQAHLWWSNKPEELARTGNCDINTYIFGRLCRTIGYSDLGGNTDYQVLREKIHEEHGTLPTITVRGADQIITPNDDFKRIFEVVK
jgi:hypothetical protein